jgi:hypothetical protein
VTFADYLDAAHAAHDRNLIELRAIGPHRYLASTPVRTRDGKAR